MQSSQLTIFANSLPFEAFRIFIADGRQVNVTHPEMVMIADYAESIWAFHSGGQAELIDGALITSLKTLGPVDPDTFIPRRPEKDEG